MGIGPASQPSPLLRLTGLVILTVWL